ARVWHAASKEWRHCDTFSVPVKSETGEVIEWVGTTTDVEDRYQREALEHLRSDDERTRLAEAAARLGSWEWDLRRNFVWSPGMSTLFGARYPGSGRNQIIDEVMGPVHPDDRQSLFATFANAARECRGIDVEYRVAGAEGQTRWLNARASYLPATESAPARMVGVTIDITDQVEAREALSRASAATSEALALVDAVLDRTPAAVALFDKDMRWLRINAAAAEMDGLPVEAHIGRRLEELLPDIGPRAAETYREVWRTGKAIPAVEISGETPAQPGVVRTWAHSAVPIRDDKGRVTAVAVIGYEFTERKRAEEALRKAEQQERLLSQVTKAMIEPLDEPQTLSLGARLAVPGFADVCALFLFDQPSLPGAGWGTAGDAGDQALLSSLEIRDWFARPGSDERVSEMLMGGSSVLMASSEDVLACAPSKEARDRAARGGLTSLICVPLWRHGKAIGVAAFAMIKSGRKYEASDVAVAQDLAERIAIVVENARLIAQLRETAEDLRHANAAKDDFLGMVTHELKSPLTTIIGNADLLKRPSFTMTEEDRKQAIEDVNRSAATLERLINDLLELARLERGHALPVEPVIVRRIISGLVESRPRLNSEREITLHTKARITPVLAVPGYIEEIVANFISNADKYSPEGKEIEVEVHRQGSEVVIEVLDRGPGISAEDAEHIFEPFYRSPRTAGLASGLGIGLALCKRLVDAQGGRIWVRPREGGGSAFGFALPALAEESKHAGRTAAALR
ncbi:MAG TPA: PAS domain-containing protein, partial [Dehalococcoidia bacterium]